MATVVKPPSRVVWDDRKTVFLAGTIDNGASIDWQSRVEKELDDLDVLILNPRRAEWDSSWKQTIDNQPFREQVEWELEGLDRVDEIFVYFAPHSQSPITLLELGLHARKGNVTIVCEKEFWRKGNIEVLAQRYNLSLFEELEEGLAILKDKLNKNPS